ncbi:MAG: hypothetical protein H3C50_02295 [Kiritimatiellae bacterium]|nr:hypothetical protein [Kiritimatiellia bacterium]MCO5062668.1 hypothetical protein [Kiritimatiellia bacterium]MCO5068514.1 hypothetical protein [Kiritimatiellia bacterium]
MTQDDEHLNLLGLFHYVVGGVTAIFSCIPLIHVGIGLAMLYGNFDGPNPPPAIVGWMFVVLGSCFILCGWTLSAFMIATGRRLRQRRSRTFCFVVACVECMFMPFGTVLGVFTIIVLNRASIQRLMTSAHKIGKIDRQTTQ